MWSGIGSAEQFFREPGRSAVKVKSLTKDHEGKFFRDQPNSDNAQGKVLRD